ncbi:MAG: head-tail connector protein [Pseudomonadota bacterium]
MIDLTEAKLHLRVDIEDDDTAIQTMIDAATAATLDFLNLDEFGVGGMPEPVKCATLLLIGDLYENRERQGDKALYRNDTYERLLNPYRVMEA